MFRLTASWTRTGVASLLGLLTVTLSEVVGTGVNNDGTAEDALWANQLDELVRYGALSVSLSVGLEVAQVTNVTLRIGWSTVGLAVWVDCRLVNTE